ncbi:hypothetical protein GCM10023214_12080 [Amycolatopsis dongchuanensis]|uniref:Uncharacterized protein n=1 Tax=Amycolatopsis dongchuanensis TaxID=1070866 RepID=A0ABP9Q2L6_9PSEU
MWGVVSEELHRLNATLERYSRNLLAVDAANYRQAQLVADYLLEAEQATGLMYETGRTK